MSVSGQVGAGRPSLLVALVVLQGCSAALAADGEGGGRAGPSGSIGPIAPFAQGASVPAVMARPFHEAFRQAVSPASRAPRSGG